MLIYHSKLKKLVTRQHHWAMALLMTFCHPFVLGNVNATELSVKANRTVYVGTLKNGSPLHGNRTYSYKNLPERVRGLHYTLHDHKAASDLAVHISKGGELYLALFEHTKPENVVTGLRWDVSGTAGSTAGGEVVTFYKTTVESGRELTFKSVDKWGAVLVAEKINGLKPAPEKPIVQAKPGAAKAAFPSGEYGDLQRQIAESPKWNRERLKKEALRPEALVLETDKTPVDIILRRTAALLKHLQNMPDGPGLTEEEAELQKLKEEYAPDMSSDALRGLFARIANLRRQIAFQNPLLDFNKILFIKHDKQARGEHHMVDQYLGFNQSKRGGVYVLENPFSKVPNVRSLLAGAPVRNGRLKGKTIENNGSFISLELDWDAKTVYFAFTEAVATNVKPEDRVCDGLLEKMKNISKNHYYWAEDRVFHIFKADLTDAGSLSNLRQITFGKYNDFDPCVLPSGRLVFISGRIGGNQRCGNRLCSTYTLHGMMNDGSDIIPLSFHDTNEWHPSVDNDGMIVYSRWDYVDRDSDIAHAIWHCFPDGRDPRSYHGNYPRVRESRPWMELAIRAIPGSWKYVAVAAPHHGQNYGSLVLLDLRKKDDFSMSQIKRITPEALLPESESAPGVQQGKGRHRPNGEVYGQPWPLNEDFYLCVYSPERTKHAIALIDSFGNREILYQDPQIGCLDPMPLRPRPRPPVIPVRTRQAKVDRQGDQGLSMGTVSILNIYEGEYAWPEGTRIKALRVINVFPKPNFWMDRPRIGMPAQSLARGVLGTVPVEEDGSVYFTCPTGAGIYFQALDEKGMMVQNMRSTTYLHPGELLSCIGCHEAKQAAPKNGAPPMALRRPPSKITPEVTGSYPLTFPRLVQPVLDAKCLSCHGKDPKAPSLRGDVFAKNGWSEAMATLSKYAWGKSGGNGAIRKNGRSYSIPGQEGARVSKLYHILSAGHHGVTLTAEEMRRITLWLDCNSNFFGAYYDEDKQQSGEIVRPLLGVPSAVSFETLRR